MLPIHLLVPAALSGAARLPDSTFAGPGREERIPRPWAPVVLLAASSR
ncbi:MAG TPA: hypothetical protein VHG51_01505 [Longimicrobiaceae bacterium]|nr:hypothetical protein [Longimicrobiaceae bacterium]